MGGQSGSTMLVLLVCLVGVVSASRVDVTINRLELRSDYAGASLLEEAAGDSKRSLHRGGGHKTIRDVFHNLDFTALIDLEQADEALIDLEQADDQDESGSDSESEGEEASVPDGEDAEGEIRERDSGGKSEDGSATVVSKVKDVIAAKVAKAVGFKRGEKGVYSISKGKNLNVDVGGSSMHSYQWDPSKGIGGRPDKFRYSTKFKKGHASAGVQLEIGVKVLDGVLKKFWMKFSAKFDTDWQTDTYFDGSVDQCRAEPYCYFIIGCKTFRGRDGAKETGTCKQHRNLLERFGRLDFKPIEIKIGTHYDLVFVPRLGVSGIISGDFSDVGQMDLGFGQSISAEAGLKYDQGKGWRKIWMPPTQERKAPAPIVAVRAQPRADYKVTARTSFRLIWLPLGKLTEEVLSLGMGLRFAESIKATVNSPEGGPAGEKDGTLRVERGEVFDAVAELDFLGFPTLRHRHIVSAVKWEDGNHTGPISAFKQATNIPAQGGDPYYMTNNVKTYRQSLYKRNAKGKVKSRNGNKFGQKRTDEFGW